MDPVDRVVYGTGTVIARQAHAHLRHGGPFEACPRCCRDSIRWRPSVDPGVLVYARDGRLVERSEAVRKLLMP